MFSYGFRRLRRPLRHNSFRDLELNPSSDTYMEEERKMKKPHGSPDARNSVMLSGKDNLYESGTTVSS